MTAARLALAADRLGRLFCVLAGMQEGDASPASADLIIAEDVAYVDSPIALSAGGVFLAIANHGDAVHDITIDGPDGTRRIRVRRSRLDLRGHARAGPVAGSTSCCDASTIRYPTQRSAWFDFWRGHGV